MLSQNSFSQNISEERNSILNFYYLDVNRIFPTYRPSEEKVFVYSGYLLRTGALSKFRDNSLIAQYKFSKNNIDQKIGLSVNSRVKGELFNASRGHIRYIAAVAINRNMTFKAGIDAGIYSYSFRASNISSGTAFQVFDGNFSLGLDLYDQHHISISSSQFTGTEYNGNRNQFIALPRDINVLYEFKKQLNPQLFLRASAWSRLDKEDFYLNTNLVLEFEKIFGGSWGMDYNRVTTLGIFFPIKQFEKTQLNFYVNYNLPMQSTIVNVSPMELSLVLFSTPEKS